jgi:hypothetical protein
MDRRCIFRVGISNGKTHIIEKIKNIDLMGLNNVNIFIEFPKEIIKSTDELSKIDNFEIINKDPKIKFGISDIKPRREKIVEYIIKKQLTKDQINTIILTLDTKEIDIKEREELFNKTQEVINITTTITPDYKNNQTEFKIDIDLKKDALVKNADIYTEIPKCMIEAIDELMINSGIEFDIVNKDPLIVWHFTRLTKGEQLKFLIKSVADEDCLNKVKTYVIARNIVNKNFFTF